MTLYNQITKTLRTQTQLFLSVVPDAYRQRTIHWFLEDLPTTSTHLIGYHGGRCLVGSSLPQHLTRNDDGGIEMAYQPPLQSLSPQVDLLDIMLAFDRVYSCCGAETTRQVVTEEIRTWLREHLQVQEPLLV